MKDYEIAELYLKILKIDKNKFIERGINKFNRRFLKYNINEKIYKGMLATEDLKNNMELSSQYVERDWELRKIKRIFNSESKKRSRL